MVKHSRCERIGPRRPHLPLYSRGPIPEALKHFPVYAPTRTPSLQLRFSNNQPVFFWFFIFDILVMATGRAAAAAHPLFVSLYSPTNSHNIPPLLKHYFLGALYYTRVYSGDRCS
jgi:hypothetical protein